jgi:hypothetical protein
MAPELSNPVSQVSSYGLEHLVGHLHRSGRWTDLHRLLALETDDGRNAWYEAKRLDAGYVQDISIARRSIDPTQVTLAAEARYALIGASLHSRGGNSPPALLRALVASGVWSIDQGLNQVHRLIDPEDRARALVLLSEFGDSGCSVLIQEAEDLLPSIAEIGVRDAVAQAIANRYGAVGEARHAIRVVGQIQDQLLLRQTLGDLLAAHSRTLLAETNSCFDSLTPVRRLEILAGAIARAADDSSLLVDRATREWEGLRADSSASSRDAVWARVMAGVPLLPHLDGARRTNFLADAYQAIESGGAQLFLLEKLAPWLPMLTDGRAMEAVFAADYIIEEQRATALGLLAHALPAADRAEAVRRLTGKPIRPSSFLGGVVAACITLEPDRHEELAEYGLVEIEGNLGGPERSNALEMLTPKLSGRLVIRALELAGEIKEDDHRFSALQALAPRCNELDAARALLTHARRFYDPEDNRAGNEGFRRRCRLSAPALAQISRDERKAEVRPLISDLQNDQQVTLCWDGLVCLLPFIEGIQEAENTATAMCAALLEHHFLLEGFRIESYFERLPRGFHKPVLKCILNHAEVEPRNRVLAGFAPRLAAEDLKNAANYMDAIADVPTQRATIASLRELMNQEDGRGAQDVLASLLEAVSRRIGVWVEEAAQWVHVLVAERLARLGDIDRALAATDLIEAHTFLYRRSLASVASRLPPDRIYEEVERRIAGRHEAHRAGRAGRSEPGSTTAFYRGKPENLELLIRHADLDFRLKIREQTLPRDATEYGRAKHFAQFAPAIPDDRSVRIGDFLRSLVNEPSSSEFAVIEALVPFMDPSMLERCAELVDSAALDDTVVRVAFALAARDSTRFEWAVTRWGQLDKWDRVPCAVTHAGDFSRHLRAELSREVAREARARLQDRGTIFELCMAAIVPENETERVGLLCEALEAASTKPHSGEVRQNHTVIGAYLFLVLEATRLAALRVALQCGSTGFREHLLSALDGLCVAIRSATTIADMDAIGIAIDDVARWWR